jgi:hypothetical protein
MLMVAQEYEHLGAWCPIDRGNPAVALAHASGGPLDAASHGHLGSPQLELPLHHGELPPVRRHEVWAEGYAVTGGRGNATMLGDALGRTFDEAVLDLMRRRPDLAMYHGQDAKGHTHWGCRLYPTRAQAQRSFG